MNQEYRLHGCYYVSFKFGKDQDSSLKLAFFEALKHTEEDLRSKLFNPHEPMHTNKPLLILRSLLRQTTTAVRSMRSNSSPNFE